ncbi:acyltransferase family protein [Pseudorhodoferax sp.]|uniref:acyltransferase family protein n=1 Tax=Pseudorhodoferax sp. TaxID=1993553 RepID=UPI0039E42606
MPPSPGSSFRADINGLRAWAVIGVVLYHFQVPGFAGGFAGVDVFFVLSGFLMTGIALRGLESARFALADFYAARARRILPALMALCAVLLAAGWFVLLPQDYRTLATHVIASVTFLSNFKYWGEAGYFDTASHEKWLLHTWSLAVEWQFYLLLPLAMVVIWRLWPGRRAQWTALLLVFVASLGLSVWDTQAAPSRAFYLLHARAWELVGGGLCVFLRTPDSAAWRKRLETLGMAMILGSLLGFDVTTPWPGWRALLPVAGTMLVLTAQRRSAWTGHALAQWLGTRSYSLYLWHWPVVVALFYWDLLSTPWAVLLGLGIVLALADASYRWIETPGRDIRMGRRPSKSLLAFAAGSAVACAAAVLVRQADGVPDRFPPQLRAVAAESDNANPRRTECHPARGVVSPSCVYGGPRWRAIVLGDSHGDALMTAAAQALPTPHDGVVQWTYSGCAFIPGLETDTAPTAAMPQGYHCDAFKAWALAQLEQVPPSVPVILVNRYAELDGEDAAHASPSLLSLLRGPQAQQQRQAAIGRQIVDAACTVAEHRRVYLLRPIPEYSTDVPRTLARRMAWGVAHGEVAIPLEQYREDYAWVNAAIDTAQAQCGVVPLDPTRYLCDEHFCYGSIDDRPLYHDDDHLSEYGNKRLVPMFREIFEQMSRSLLNGEQ